MDAKKVAIIRVEIEVFDDSRGWYDFDEDINDDWPSIITDYVGGSINESSAVINAEVSYQVSSISWELVKEGNEGEQS